MANVSMNAALEQFVAVLDEAFSRSPRSWSHFTDPSPDSGYFGTLSKIDVAKAARPIAGTSVAAQVSHVTFAMHASSAFIRADSEPPGLEQWQQSWRVPELDEDTWRQMQTQLREAYYDLRRAIESHGVSQIQSLGGVIGAIAHVAYHLGAIKQKIAIVGTAEPDAAPDPAGM